jgi:hypothetical protein
MQQINFKTYPFMKKFLSLAAFVLIVFVLNAQDAVPSNNDWINRINMVETDDCIDSVTCYTEVIVDVNRAVLIDSAYVKIIIGSTPGGSDIYNQRYQYTSSVTSLPNVSVADDGALKFSLGKFIVTESFFVDMLLE